MEVAGVDHSRACGRGLAALECVGECAESDSGRGWVCPVTLHPEQGINCVTSGLCTAPFESLRFLFCQEGPWELGGSRGCRQP